MEGMNKWWKVEPAELKKEDGSDLSGTDLEDCLYGKMIEQTKAYIVANDSSTRSRINVAKDAYEKMTGFQLYNQFLSKVDKVPTNARMLKAGAYHCMEKNEWDDVAYAIVDVQVVMSMSLMRESSAFKSKIEQYMVETLPKVLTFEPFGLILSYTDDVTNEGYDTFAMDNLAKMIPPTTTSRTVTGKGGANMLLTGMQLTDKHGSTECLPFLFSAQREGATYDEVKYLVAKHKELASLLQSELIKCKTINGKVLTDAEKVTLTEKFLERAIKWATPSASARALRDQVLNFRHMSEGEMWRTYFDEFRGKLEMARMACQMEGIEPDSIEKDHSLCVMLRSKLTSELRVQHAIKENMWDEMGEMGQAIKDEAYGDLYDFFRYVDKMEAATKEGKPKDKSISTATGSYNAEFDYSRNPPSHDATCTNQAYNSRRYASYDRHEGSKRYKRTPAEVFPDRNFNSDMPWPPPGGCLEVHAFGICRRPGCTFRHDYEPWKREAPTRVGEMGQMRNESRVTDGTQVSRWTLPTGIPQDVRRIAQKEVDGIRVKREREREQQQKGNTDEKSQSFCAVRDYSCMSAACDYSLFSNSNQMNQ